MEINTKTGEIVLYITSAKKYVSTNLQILREQINKKKAYCVYVTANRPYTSLINLFKTEKIDTERLFVIDTVTPVGEGTRAGNAVFTGSPRGLTHISIATTSAIQSLPKGNRLLFLDSISALVLYNTAGSVTEFTHFLINKMRAWSISGAIISLEKETDEKMLSQLTQFCDKVIEVK